MPENDCPGCRRDQDVTPERPELAEGRFRPELAEGLKPVPRVRPIPGRVR